MSYAPRVLLNPSLAEPESCRPLGTEMLGTEQRLDGSRASTTIASKSRRGRGNGSWVGSGVQTGRHIGETDEGGTDKSFERCEANVRAQGRSLEFFSFLFFSDSAS